MARRRRQKKVELPALPDELFRLMEARYEKAQSKPIGEWWRLLEEVVIKYNEVHGSAWDERLAVHAFLHKKVNRGQGR